MSENNQDQFKKQLDEHQSMMNERFEDAFNRTVVLKSLDLVALEAMRLEIPNWESMKLGELRAEIKRLQAAEKIKK
jgi:hypothetical protein